MIDNELLLLAAALVLLFALPLALLAWMAAQYAQMRQLAHRLERLEVSVQRAWERGESGHQPPPPQTEPEPAESPLDEGDTDVPHDIESPADYIDSDEDSVEASVWVEGEHEADRAEGIEESVEASHLVEADHESDLDEEDK